MRHVYAALTGFALASLVFFCSLIAFQTLVPSEPPLQFAAGTAKAYPEGDDTVVIYQRDIKAVRHAHYDLERSISCDYADSHYVLDLPPLIRELREGETKHVSRVVNFPVRLPAGTRCSLQTALLWAPQFSMVSHTAMLPSIDFVVQEK